MARKSFVLAGALLIAVASFFSARYWAGTHAAPRQVVVGDSFPAPSQNAEKPTPVLPKAENVPQKTSPEDEPAIQFFPEAVDSEANLQVMLSGGEAAVETTESNDQEAGSTTNSPKTLEAAGGAPLLKPDKYGLHKAIIRDELSDAGPDEQQVWIDELKDLDPKSIREILRLRRHFAPSFAIEQPSTTGLRMHTEHAATPTKVAVDPAIGTTWPGTMQAVRTIQHATAHNLANAGTYGFKRWQVLVEDRMEPLPNNSNATNAASRFPARGISVRGIRLDMRQGKLEETGRMLDVAIDGPGFLQALDRDRIVYTRAGILTWDREGDGILGVMSNGELRPLEPQIAIPEGATSINVSPNGTVSFESDGVETPTVAGQLQLAFFSDPAALEPLGGTLYEETLAAGLPVLGSPGEKRFGTIKQGYLECSNVDADAELNALEMFDHWRDVVSGMTLR